VGKLSNAAGADIVFDVCAPRRRATRQATGHRVRTMACAPALSELRRACPGFLTVADIKGDVGPTHGAAQAHQAPSAASRS
jgi:hypothetical protein